MALREPIVSPSADPILSARVAGLRYVSDRMPGLRRRSAGRRLQYVTLDGALVTDEKELGRIRALVIPPAWTDVWVCRLANGHLQATGRDARGRKQYRYHSRWREVRDETKYDRMIAFGRALTRIRERVGRDLSRSGLPREKVLATVVRLLEKTLIRVGNEEYARQNDSFGLTTLREHHVSVSGSTLRFRFRGKSGVEHTVDVNDRRLARIVEQCRDLPGYELFQYVDDDGQLRSIESSDVNGYLRAIADADFTAKDFRTWAGTVLAARALQELPGFDSQAQAKRHVVAAIEAVSRILGNTKAVCRKCYVHPAVIDMYLNGSLLEALHELAPKELSPDLGRLRLEEAAVLALLERRLGQEGAARNGGAAVRREPKRQPPRQQQAVPESDFRVAQGPPRPRPGEHRASPTSPRVPPRQDRRVSGRSRQKALG